MIDACPTFVALMKELLSLRIGGVPEHFNLPWHLAMEDRAFVEAGVVLSWEDFPGGTGAMTRALREDKLDVAVVLTEGIVADIVKGNPSSIIGQYVRTPLIWGIHTGAASKFQSVEELNEERFAISRNGSGSHIITYVMAQQRAWDPSKQNFVKVGNLEGARESLAALESDGFLWEKFTTKPYVDSGEFRRLGEVRTPWPCFVMAARNSVLASNAEAIEIMLSVIRKYCLQFMYRHDAIELVASRYGLEVKDAARWYGQTQWSSNDQMSRPVLHNVINTLNAVGVIDEKPKIDTLCSPLVKFGIFE